MTAMFRGDSHRLQASTAGAVGMGFKPVAPVLRRIEALGRTHGPLSRERRGDLRYEPDGLHAQMNFPAEAARARHDTGEERIMKDAKNLRILVVEDETIIAMDLQDMLEDAGYKVIGPVGTVGDALDILDREQPDLALLDVNLGGEEVFRVASRLAGKNARIIFLTGDSGQRLPEEHRHRPLIAKPFLPRTVLDAIQRIQASRVNGT